MTALLLCLAVPSMAAEAPIGALCRIKPAGGYVEVRASADVAVEQVLAAVDQSVIRGAPLAQLDRRALQAEFEAAQLRLEHVRAVGELLVRELKYERDAAEQSLKLARADLQSYRSLREDATSAREVRRREDQVEQARLEHAAKDVALDRQQRVNRHDERMASNELARAQQRLDDAVVTSPLDATVIAVHVSPGERTGGPLFTLADLSAIEAQCDVFEGDLGRVRVGQKALLRSRVFEQPLPATVSRVGRRVDPVGKVGKVWVSLQSPEPAAHYLDMEVDLEITP